MARKQIASGVDDVGKGWCGPFVDGNDNVYVIKQNDMWKAGTDPLVDAWTIQDAANDPNIAIGSGELAAWQDGTEIHYVAYDSTDARYEYSRFRTSDHASADTWANQDEVIDTPTNAPTTPACFIAVRSDGDVIVLYNGDTDKIMGVDYERVDYARREGGTWTSGINVHGDGLEQSFLASGIGRDSSDYIHFAFGASAGSCLSKSLSAANALSGLVTVSSDSDADPTMASPTVVFNDRAGADVMTFAYRVAATGEWESRAVRDRTNSELTASMSGTDADADPHICLAVDGDDVYAVYRDDGDDINYQKKADQGAWGEITTVSTATAPTEISANVIDHGGGKVLAVVYADTNTYYDELYIGPVSLPTPLPYQNRRHNHLLRR